MAYLVGEKRPLSRPHNRSERIINVGRDNRQETSSWRTGTAYVLDDDDPNERVRILGESDPWRRLCLGASKTTGTSLLTVRSDLDPR